MLPPDSLASALHQASQLVAGVLSGRNFTDALAALWRSAPDISPAQRGAISDLGYQALRDYGRGHFFLDRLLHKPLTEPETEALLLVAISRLARRPEQAYVLVDQAVQASAGLGSGAARGLVNAVLRNFLRQRRALETAAADDDVATWCHPAWWLDRLKTAEPTRWQSIASAGNSHPPMSLRVNRRRARPDTVLAQLAAAGLAGQPIGEDGILLDKPCPVSALPGFAEGCVSVQDAGAQCTATWLRASDGMRVLDACAAPGGKTAHILERAQADLLALDADATRARRIDDNLARLGLHAQVRVADCRDRAAWWDGRPFDRILADVPCSASGVVRRHPDIKWLRREQDIARFAAQQREILDALWPTLAPGGQLLYATCSVFAAENQSQVAAFLARHADCERLPIDGADDQPLLPGPQHDGFYYARLKKRD